MHALLATLLISLAGFTAFASDVQEVSVNGALPDNRQIWPLPAPTAAIEIEAEFVSVQTLLKVRAGNWFCLTKRAVYRVTKVHGTFPAPEINFLFQDSLPTPESGIMVKKLDSPFAPKTHARFWISPRRDDPIWDIQTYEIWNEYLHRKPGA